MGALTVEFARHRYRFAGLTPEQTDLGRSRFGVLLCRDDGTSDIQVDVHYVPSHSAAFTDGVRGFLFCGRSGAGKTTLCGLADELNADPLLIDELTTRVAQLVERIPLRILSFAKDTTFWSVLDHEYRSPHAMLPRWSKSVGSRYRALSKSRG